MKSDDKMWEIRNRGSGLDWSELDWTGQRGNRTVGKTRDKSGAMMGSQKLGSGGGG